MQFWVGGQQDIAHDADLLWVCLDFFGIPTGISTESPTRTKGCSVSLQRNPHEGQGMSQRPGHTPGCGGPRAGTGHGHPSATPAGPGRGRAEPLREGGAAWRGRVGARSGHRSREPPAGRQRERRGVRGAERRERSERSGGAMAGAAPTAPRLWLGAAVLGWLAAAGARRRGKGKGEGHGERARHRAQGSGHGSGQGSGHGTGQGPGHGTGRC